MKFKEAMNIINGLIDYYYEENCSTGVETEEYKEMAKAESALEKLVKLLEANDIYNINDIETINGRKA